MEDKPIEVNQRLTAAYGRERVKGGKGFKDPTIEALIKADFQADYAHKQLEEIYENIEYAKSLVIMCGDSLHYRSLYMFYIEAWRVEDIAKQLGCRTPRWAKYLLRDARFELKRILSHK